MTTAVYPGPNVYTISGPGPYPITHEYVTEAIEPFVILNGLRVDLTADQYFVSPDTGDQGQLILSGGASTIFNGLQLTIGRKTPLVQSFDGGNPIQRAIMGILNRLMQAVQELRYRIESIGPSKLVAFSSRADAEAATVSFEQNIIDVLTPQGRRLSYRRDPSGTALITANGVTWSPVWPPRPDHYAENVDPGTTDMAAAINACLTENGVTLLFPDDYAVGSIIEHNSVVICGENAHWPRYSALVGLSGSLGVGSPMLGLGRSAVFENVTVEFDALTGSEGEGERVGFRPNGPGGVSLQRGARIDKIRFRNVGTAIDDFGIGAFSIHFGVIDIATYSYAGVNLRATNGTGNSWDNLYMGSTGDAGSEYTATYGFRSAQRYLGSIQQLNIEHSVHSEGALVIEDCLSGHIQSLHLEGVDIAADGGAYIKVNGSYLTIENLGVINTRAAFDNLAVVDLGAAGTWDLDNESGTTQLTIGNFNVAGISDPNSGLYPSYPSERRGIHNIPGFEFFRRDASHTVKDYKLKVGHYIWGAYLSTALDTREIYKYAISRHSNLNYNIDVLQFGDRGRSVEPRRNFIKNGAFDTWVNSDTGFVSGPTECAAGWFIDAGAGTIKASRVEEVFGGETQYLIRIDNTDDAQNFDGLYQDIQTDWRTLMGEPVVLSFDIKANVTGRLFRQVTMSFFTDGGSPTDVFKQISPAVEGIDVDLADTWYHFELPFVAVADADVTSYGANPFHRLEFFFNDAVAGTYSGVYDLRKVKLERGVLASDFIRHRSDP